VAMTLCIAAHSHLGGVPRIVLCCDSLIGDQYGVSEAAFKCDLEFAHGLAALWAGTVEQVEDALPIFRARFREKLPRLDDCKEELFVGMKELKATLARRGLRRTDVQLVVAGFIEGTPRIIYVGADGVSGEPSYRTIGTGWPSADAILRWRHYTKHEFLHNAMYLVYEAKRFGETSPFVGKMTTMFVLEPKEDSFFGCARWYRKA
jgi:hypothetical protein